MRIGWFGPDRTPDAAKRCQKDLLVGCCEVRGSEVAERGARGMGSRGGSTAEGQGQRQTIGRRGPQRVSVAKAARRGAEPRSSSSGTPASPASPR